MSETIISRLFLGLDSREFRNGIRQADRELKDWSKGIGKIGDMLGAAFAVGIIADFTMEAVKLGDQLEAAARGFERFGTAADLDRLRSSTQGMVSDVKLLQQAVQAGNFGIPVKELGNLFEFAQKRAKETGQEVDYLTNSIVTGIGRKSPLILDNLGISASMLRDKLHGITVESASIASVTKAVGEIASEQLKLMGGSAQDATTSSQQLVATWENFKAESGQIFSPIVNGVLKVLQAVINTTKAITGMGEAQKTANGEISGLGIWGIVHQKVTEEVEKTTRALLNMGETMRGIWTTFNSVGYTTLAGMKSRLAELQKEFENTDISSGKIKTLRQEIEKLQAEINKITNPEKLIPKVETATLVDLGDYLEEINAELFKGSDYWFTYGERMADALDTSALEEFMHSFDETIDEVIPGIVDLSSQYERLNGVIGAVAGTIGNVLNESFTAALTNGEDFFKVFLDGLKKMAMQLAATAAAALALSIILASMGVGKGASIGKLFKVVGGQMGLPGLGGSSFNPLTGNVEGGLFGGRTTLRGNDIFLANSRSGYDLGRIGG